MIGAGQIQNPPWMENRVLAGTAASGWAMVLPNWNRELLLKVVPPPATTLRVMVKRLLLCAWATDPKARRIINKKNILILIGNDYAPVAAVAAIAATAAATTTAT
jgi:hypothetical protein